MSNKRRYKGVAISQSVQIAKEKPAPKKPKLSKGRLKPSEMAQPFTTATPTPGPYLGPVNSAMLAAWEEALVRRNDRAS